MTVKKIHNKHKIINFYFHNNSYKDFYTSYDGEKNHIKKKKLMENYGKFLAK